MKATKEEREGKFILLAKQDTDWLAQRAANDGVSMSAIVRQLIRADRRAHERGIDFAE